MSARRYADNGIACVKFDFYGCGESDGDFSEMRYMDEMEQAETIYLWAGEQPWYDRDNMFPASHNVGETIVSNIVPQLQPRRAVVWAPGNVAYYGTNSRVRAIPDHYEELYDVGGPMVSSEFLSQVRKADVIRQAEGYSKEVFIIYGELDEKAPVYVAGPYLDLYGERAHSEIIKGANHRFTSVEWKNRVYKLSIDYTKEKVGSTEKYLLEDRMRSQ